MKKFLIFLLFFSLKSYAFDDKSIANEAVLNLTKQFEIYAQQKSNEVEGDVYKDFEKLSSLRLDEKKDLELVKNVLKIVLKLDETEPSRTGVMILAPSYEKNAELYKKAFRLIRTNKNKNQLKEIEELMKSSTQFGNG